MFNLCNIWLVLLAQNRNFCRRQFIIMLSKSIQTLNYTFQTINPPKTVTIPTCEIAIFFYCSSSLIGHVANDVHIMYFFCFVWKMFGVFRTPERFRQKSKWSKECHLFVFSNTTLCILHSFIKCVSWTFFLKHFTPYLHSNITHNRRGISFWTNTIILINKIEVSKKLYFTTCFSLAIIGIKKSSGCHYSHTVHFP